MQSTWSLKGPGLSHLQLINASQVCETFARYMGARLPTTIEKSNLTAVVWPHQLELWKWRVVTELRKILSEKWSQALSALILETLYIQISPRLCDEMNPCIWSLSNDNCWFITYLGVFALAVALPFPLRLPIGTIAASWKWTNISVVSIMIPWNVAEETAECIYKVLKIIGCVLEWDALFCASYVMSTLFCMLAEWLIGGAEFDTGGKDNEGVGRNEEYTYSRSCDLVHIPHVVR
jgi:hypothetical protein